jgi:hypothetical protein
MAERNDANDQAAPPGGQQQSGQQPGQQSGQDAGAESGREGHSERAGEGGYGNDTGFATGTQASREDDGGGAVDAGTSVREEQTSNTYRDTGQGRGTL